MIVRKYRAATVQDAYARYPLFRAKIWSRELDDEDFVVRVEDVRCHAAIWNFSSRLCVAVVLDRVSYLLAFNPACD
jgi:hypothetical protein